MFKQTMYELFDQAKTAGTSGPNVVVDKLGEIEEKLEKLDAHFEYLATTAEKSDKL